MELEIGNKLVLKKPNGRGTIEISRHKDPILDNILVVNSIGSTKYEDSWITQKDLDVWINHIKNDGYTDIKTIEDVESSEKNNKKKT